MDVSGKENVSLDSVDSTDKATELLCDLSRTASSNMFSDLDYTETEVRRELQGGKPPKDGGSGGDSKYGSKD